MNEKCRHPYPEANHGFSFHLCCLSDANFEDELSEKIRFLFGTSKILIHLWFIVHEIYMVEFVLKNGASFMFTFSDLIEKWGRYKFKNSDEEVGAMLKMKSHSGLGLF